MVDYTALPTPLYLLHEDKLRRNLALIREVARAADIDIILAFKAYALWKTFHIFREYISSTTASSLSEARLAAEEFGAPPHTFATAYTNDDFDSIASLSSHLTFNSLTQYRRFAHRARAVNPDILIGIRVNPEYSEVGTELYNPCAAGSRLGITADQLPAVLPADITGLHVHCHCESGADQLQRTLTKIIEKFHPWLMQVQWLNLGGGHLLTRQGYDTALLIRLMHELHERYPHLRVILEPGSAFAWQTGELIAQVEDIVVNHGKRTAVMNVSFTCHMPDCLEMPYHPTVRGATCVPDDDIALPCVCRDGDDGAVDQQHVCRPGGDSCLASDDALGQQHVYRLGGNSCLAGDVMRAWRFDHELTIGERLIFEDMLHYTTVKTTMFNGIQHPAIALLTTQGNVQLLKTFTYHDYKHRMD